MTNKKKFNFKSKVIVWKSGYNEGNDKGAWRFARVPEDISAQIKKIQLKEIKKGKRKRGWGAVYARAKIVPKLSKESRDPGSKSLGRWWTTSIFPDRHSNTYILPLKKQIRYEENLYDGIEVKVTIEIWF